MATAMRICRGTPGALIINGDPDHMMSIEECARQIVDPKSLPEPRERALAHPICEMTTISSLGARLEDADPKLAGSGIEYANGKYGVSYEYVPQISRDSRIGDPIRLCLIAKQVDCPPGDDRGRKYRAVNLRTGGRWTLYDTEHLCGGA